MMDENKKAAQKKKVSHFITIAVLVILFLAFIFPFIMVIFNAFKTKGDITADPLALVGSHGFILTNFTDAMKKMNFATSFTNSLLITTVSTILTIMLSAMTAFVIVRNKWKACGILFSLMIASMVIPFQVLMIPLVLWSTEQPYYSDPYACGIFPFHGNIHVPRCNSHQRSDGAGRSSIY